MREFAIPFKQGLKNGLRKFPQSIRDEEWLTECRNLMPSEKGLIPHETIIELGVSTIVTSGSFDFIRMKDQSGVEKFWFINNGPNLESRPVVPVISGKTGNEITPATIPWALQVTAYDDASTMFIYPIEETFQVESIAPALGSKYNVSGGLAMVAVDGVTYNLKAHSGGYYAMEI